MSDTLEDQNETAQRRASLASLQAVFCIYLGFLFFLAFILIPKIPGCIEGTLKGGARITGRAVKAVSDGYNAGRSGK